MPRYHGEGNKHKNRHMTGADIRRLTRELSEFITRINKVADDLENPENARTIRPLMGTFNNAVEALDLWIEAQLEGKSKNPRMYKKIRSENDS